MSDQTQDPMVLQPNLVPFETTKKKLVRLNLDLLPPDLELLSPAPTREFIQDILERKVIEPIEVSEIGKGQYFVIGGRRRIKAVRILRGKFPEDDYWKAIDAYVVAVNDHAAILAMSAGNNKRTDNPLTDLQAIDFVVKLNPQATLKEIARATGIPQGRVTQRLRLKKLIPELFDAFVDGRLTANVADAAAKLPTEFQNKLLVKLSTTRKPISLEDVMDTQRVRVQGTVDSRLSMPTLPQMQFVYPPASIPQAPEHVADMTPDQVERFNRIMSGQSVPVPLVEDACPAYGYVLVDETYGRLVSGLISTIEDLDSEMTMIQEQPGTGAIVLRKAKVVLI